MVTDRFRDHLLILIVAILCSGSSLGFAAISLPAPRGFVESSGLSDTLHAAGVAGLPPSATLLGLYYETNTVASILTKGWAPPAPVCKAVLQKEYWFESQASKSFRTLVKNAKSESDKRFDINNPATKRILNHYEDATRRLGIGTSITVEGASILGIIHEDSDTLATSMLLNMGWSDGRTQTNIPFALAAAFVRKENRILTLTVGFPFRSAQDVDRANKRLLEWLKGI